MARCKVISHRGANKFAPQNTMPAFEKSLEIGVDGFETDVHCSSDGVVVVCHNYTVDETSDGMGNIADMTFERLKELDFGSWYSDKFKGTPIPSVDDFLSLCEGKGLSVINIEIKEPKNGEKDIADKTIAAVKEHGLFDSLLISSFDPEILIQCKKVDPKCKTALLYSPDKKITYSKLLFNYVEYAKELQVEYLHPHYTFVNERYVKKLHENGVGVNPWTVDSPEQAKKLLEYGVDGIITNCPDIINKVVDEFEDNR